jgi:predicted DNA-binding transcriptional regulator AlpA
MDMQSNTQHHQQLEPFQILKQEDLMRILQVSRTTLYRMRQQPGFPRQKSVTGRGIGWEPEEFFKWLDKLESAR